MRLCSVGSSFGVKGLKIFAFCIMWGFTPLVHAQNAMPEGVPEFRIHEDRYQFPVNPGKQGLLAGTMGELRSTHFHAGLDIRTDNQECVPIQAAMNGYVTRAIIGSYGYGKVLFIKHPNGQMTVYAHLSKFNDPLGKHVRQTQYNRKSFDVDLSFSPDQFPVKQGDTIAFSGNTGGSSGPHLHFEIRDSSNEALNPLVFHFDEIRDVLPPVAQKIALKTLDINSRINDRFGRFEFSLFKNGDTYSFGSPILAHGRIGLEILAYDRMDMSGFKCGINQIEVFLDSQQVFSQTIDKINFNESRDILALMDYGTLKTRGARFNKLYLDDQTAIHHQEATGGGEILVTDKDISVRVALHDSYSNSSQISFGLKQSPPAKPVLLETLSRPYRMEFLENTLSLALRPCLDSGLKDSIILYSKWNSTLIPFTYADVHQKVFLIDLRNGMPDSIKTCQGAIHFENPDVIPSGTDYKYYSEWADVKFEPTTLYDTLFWFVGRTVSNEKEIFTLGDPSIPLRSAIDVILKPAFKYPMDKKSAVYREGNYTYLGGDWKDGRIHFKTTDLGDLVILRDTIPPAVKRINLTRTNARFRTRDNLSGIAYFEATINGEWLLMNYDYKTGILQSERLDDQKQLKGKFQLKVIDRSGNEQIFTQQIP